MTTTTAERSIPQRAVAALAALVHTLRPDWNEPGIAAEIRRHTHVPLDALVIAFTRAATDPANETPAALSQPSNRAWEAAHAWRCPRHPDARSRRTDGECAGCYADRLEDHQPVHFDRRPAPDEARALVRATRRPATPDTATTEQAPA